MNDLLKQRKKHKLTQEAVAKKAKISRTHYANIENGKRRPSPEVAQSIAQILNYDWTKFYKNGA